MSVFDILFMFLFQKINLLFQYNSELKDLYSEITTPFHFIFDMFSIIPNEYFENKNLKWLDAGAGRGRYSMCLFYLLFKGLKNTIIDAKEKRSYNKKHDIFNRI